MSQGYLRGGGGVLKNITSFLNLRLILPEKPTLAEGLDPAGTPPPTPFPGPVGPRHLLRPC